jgi:hypothetical protein
MTGRRHEVWDVVLLGLDRLARLAPRQFILTPLGSLDRHGH